MTKRKTPTPAEKRADDSWFPGHMRAAAVAADEAAYLWEKVLGPRHHVVVAARELAAEARWVARNPTHDAVEALADRAETVVRDLENLRAQAEAASLRAGASAKTRKRRKSQNAGLRLVRGRR